MLPKLSTLYRAEGDDGAPSPSPAGPGDTTEKTITQTEFDRILGERLARAEEQFKSRHKLDELSAKASELDSLRAEQDRAKAESRDKALVASGDVDKIKAEFEERIRSKDTAIKSMQDLFTAQIRDVYADLAVSKVSGDLHESAVPMFTEKIRDAIGVTFDLEEKALAVYPVGRDGGRVYDDELTIDATVKGLLEANAFMRKPAPGGSGATQAGGGEPSNAYEAAKARAAQTPTRDAIAATLVEMPVSGTGA